MNSKRVAAISLLAVALLVFVSISAVHSDYAMPLAGFATVLVIIATILALIDRGSKFSARDGASIALVALGLILTVNSWFSHNSTRMVVMSALVATIGSAQLVMD